MRTLFVRHCEPCERRIGQTLIKAWRIRAARPEIVTSEQGPFCHDTDPSFVVCEEKLRPYLTLSWTFFALRIAGFPPSDPGECSVKSRPLVTRMALEARVVHLPNTSFPGRN